MFGDNYHEDRGLIILSNKIQKNMNILIRNFSSEEEEALNFSNAKRLLSRYFVFNPEMLSDGNKVIIQGNGIPAGYKLEVYGSGLLGSDTIGEDGEYYIEIFGLSVGIHNLMFKLISPEGEVVAETIADEKGLYSVTPVGLKPEDTNLTVTIKDVSSPLKSVVVEPIESTFDATKGVILRDNDPTKSDIGAPFVSNDPDLVTSPVTKKPSEAMDVPPEATIQDPVPFITGMTFRPCSPITITLDGIIIGEGNSDTNNNYKIYLYGLVEMGIDPDSNVDIRINVGTPKPILSDEFKLKTKGYNYAFYTGTLVDYLKDW